MGVDSGLRASVFVMAGASLLLHGPAALDTPAIEQTAGDSLKVLQAVCTSLRRLRRAGGSSGGAGTAAGSLLSLGGVGGGGSSGLEGLW